MPLQNRVDPYGTIIRSPARGTFMGNRGGAIHNDQREIVRPFKNIRWITCVLEFKNRHRTVMSPRLYTELFFLDEAVAFAAGHRPCAECRRARFTAFKDAWQQAHGQTSAVPLRAPEIDTELHRARVDSNRRKVTYEAELDSLPNGTFVQLAESPNLVWDESLLLWTAHRYAARSPRPEKVRVTVLTPRPIVECFRQGYVPEIHDSSRAA